MRIAVPLGATAASNSLIQFKQSQLKSTSKYSEAHTWLVTNSFVVPTNTLSVSHKLRNWVVFLVKIVRKPRNKHGSRSFVVKKDREKKKLRKNRGRSLMSLARGTTRSTRVVKVICLVNHRIIMAIWSCWLPKKNR